MTSRPLRLAVNGASGRMGKALLEVLDGDVRFDLRYAAVGHGSEHVGKPVFASKPGQLCYAEGWARAPALDVVVDFSGPAGLATVLDHCVAQGTSLVSGTTGIDAAMEARLAVAAQSIALLRAANFSLGVAVLTRLLCEAAAALPEWDLEIVEAHHARKQDTPSGTALALGQAAADARHVTLEAAAMYGRGGQSRARAAGSIGFAAVRGGDIVGEHTALLIGQGERLELIHRATDRSIFARGALQAADWLHARAPGQWQLTDVVGRHNP